ncbi:MAG: hypothetical protein J1G30_04740 [Spirochaetales bacterium]|nr:hypothetical protein [Spirochaetales bacterium]
MTRKILGALAMMVLCSFTAVAVEQGLIGKWERTSEEKNGNNVIKTTCSIEFTDGDKIVIETKSAKSDKNTKLEADVKSVNDNTITYTYKDSNGKDCDAEIKYQNLTDKSVQFGNEEKWDDFTKAN